MLVPGGATEALYSFPGTNILYLNRRLGFLRLALQTGTSIVPVYSFNETSTYYQLADSGDGVVRAVKNTFQSILGVSLPFVTNILPKKCRVTTVVGTPLTVSKIPEPTEQDVLELMDRYKRALTDLFDEHKRSFLENGDEAHLEFV
jgi:2-acylglycerol O-acyltransferase 2